MKMTLRFLSKSLLLAAVGAMALSSQAWSQVGFRATSVYGGAEPNNAAGAIIVYNLPTTGPYAGAANGEFNVLASVTGGGSVNVAGYGVIMNLPAASGLNFNVTALPASGTPNNIPNSVSKPPFSTVTQNANLSIILGDTSVPGQPVGQPSLGVVGLFPTANQNTSVANGQGLFSVPFTVAAGTTGTFSLGMALGGNDFSGFAQSDGTVLTNPSGFPNANQNIVVRNSRRADMNGDLLIDGEDIQPFIDALANFNNYKAARPWLQHNYITDINGSLTIDGEDIQPFIGILAGGGSPAAVPEPSTVALGAMGLVALLAARFRRRKA